jgi:hypothetical protein
MAVIGGSRGARCAAHIHALAAYEIREAAKQSQRIDEREGYWRSVVKARVVRSIERQMADAMAGIINGWRAPILKTLADMGVVK